MRRSSEETGKRSTSRKRVLAIVGGALSLVILTTAILFNSTLLYLFAFIILGSIQLLFLCSGKPARVLEQERLHGDERSRQTYKDDASSHADRRYQELIEQVNIGIFRTTVGRESRFVHANPACLRLFGIQSEEELISFPAWDLFLDSTDRTAFFKEFAENDAVRDYSLRLHHKDGRCVTVSISAVLVRDDGGRPIYCDGMIRDITESSQCEREQKALVDELQESLLFLDSPVGGAVSETIVFCEVTETAGHAAKAMREAHCGAVLVRSEEDSGEMGIVTDTDIRKRVVAENRGADTPVSVLMSSPLIWVPEDALMFEALLTILEKNIDHIVVKNSAGRVTKIIGTRQFLRNQKYPLGLLLRDINEAESIERLFRVKSRLPSIVEASYNSNPDPRSITRIISSIAETVTRKCISFAEKELGPPPCAYAFLALGSVGREEQTLVTDQDNALIFADDGVRRGAEKYFSELSSMVCTWLDTMGYSFCKGEIMAMNPKWCQPLSCWEAYFTQWVSTLEPADLLEAKIFLIFAWWGEPLSWCTGSVITCIKWSGKSRFFSFISSIIALSSSRRSEYSKTSSSSLPGNIGKHSMSRKR